MRWTLWLVEDEGEHKRTAKARGPDSPTLESSSQVAMSALTGFDTPCGRWWLKSPAHQGERAISRKPSRRECRTVRRTCGDLLACFLPFARKAAGATNTRHSLRPLNFEGEAIAKLGHFMPRERGVMGSTRHCEEQSDEAI